MEHLDEIKDLSEQEQIDYMLYLFDLENKHSTILPRHDEVSWFIYFPEAMKAWVPVVRRRLKDRLKSFAIQKDWVVNDTKRSISISTEQWHSEIVTEGAKRHIEELERCIRHVTRMLDHLKSLEHPEHVTKDTITPSMIEHAREYPLSSIVDVNRAGFAKCIWHNDTHASMYCKKNFAHCFACGKTGDVIDVIREKEGLSFPDAIRRLQ